MDGNSPEWMVYRWMEYCRWSKMNPFSKHSAEWMDFTGFHLRDLPCCPRGRNSPASAVFLSRCHDNILLSMDWFKGQMTGNHVFYHQIWGFPLNFPIIQLYDSWQMSPLSIDMLKRVAFSAAVLSWASDRTILPAWACSPTVWSDTCHFDGRWKDLSGSECGWKERSVAAHDSKKNPLLPTYRKNTFEAALVSSLKDIQKLSPFEEYIRIQIIPSGNLT